jgi:hypothetical protein
MEADMLKFILALEGRESDFVCDKAPHFGPLRGDTKCLEAEE